jgi:hypothetical protein
LVSPTYFGHNAIWHIPPDQNVVANTMISVSFGKYAAKNEFMAVLIYKLKRKKRLESNMDNTKGTLTGHQLVVIWRFNDRNNFYVNAVLTKHSNIITWDDDRLKSFHSSNLASYKNNDTVENVCWLHSGTVLVTISKWNQSERKTEITISEVIRKDGSMELLWVPSNM